MIQPDQKQPSSFMGLLPLIVFVFLYILSGVISGKFDSMPLLVGMIIAAIVGFCLPAPNGQKKLTLEERVAVFCKAGGDQGLIMMIVIFILAGAFQGVATKMHAVSSITNMCLSFLPQNLILPGIFLIAIILSFAMGTSMGTIAALMPVGGAMFGDNNSFISASAIAAVNSQKVLMKNKFLLNFLYDIPAIIVNCILLAFYPVKDIALTGTYQYNPVDIVPYLLVIILSLVGMNVMSVLMIGIISCLLIGVFQGDFTLIGSMTYLQKGMAGMEDMSLICIFVGGVVGLMNYLGGIQWLIDKLSKNTKSKHGALLSIGFLIILLCLSTTNNTVAIITVGPLAVDIGKKFNLSRTRVATALSMFATNVQGFIPYAGQLLVSSAMAKVSPVAVMPYVWYCYLTLIMSLILAITDFPKIRTKSNDSYQNFEKLDDSGRAI